MTSLSNIISENTFVLMPRRRTFSRGIADIIDFSSIQKRYVASSTEKEADARAIAADWKAVGHDLEIAYARGAQELTCK